MGIFGSNSQGPVIVVTLDADKATQEAAKLDQAIDKLAQNAQKSSFSFTEFNQALEVGSRVLSLLQGAADAVFAALDRGQLITNVTTSFENLQSSVGLLASDSLEKLRVATLGVVTDLDLMRQANQALLLGLDASTFDQLAAAAVKLGAAVGQDALGALDSLVLGLGRGSPLILDNLGVIVSAEDAYKKYATALGRTVESLSELEKKEAFRASAIDAINEKSAKLADIQLTASQAADKLGVAFEGVTDSFALGLTNSESLSDSFSQLADAISEIDLNALGQLVGFLVSIPADAATGWVLLANAIFGTSESLKEMQNQANIAAGQFAKTFTSVDQVTGALDTNGRALAEANIKYLEIESTLVTLEARYKSLDQNQKLLGGGAMRSNLEETRQALEAQAETVTQLRAKEAALEGQLSKLSVTQEKVAESGEKLVDIYKLISDKIAGDGFGKQIEKLEQDFADGAISSQDLSTALIKLSSEMILSGISIEDVNSKLEGFNTSVEASEKLVDGLSLVTKKLQTEGFNQSLGELEVLFSSGAISSGQLAGGIDALAEAMQKAGVPIEDINNLLKGLDVNAKLAESSSASLSDILAKGLLGDGFSADAIAGVSEGIAGIGAILSEVLFDKLGLESGGLGARLGQAIGTAVGAYIGDGSAAATEAGGFFGETVGAFVDKLTGATSDAGTLARRNVESFIDDVISEINFQIIDKQGNALSITDLVLGDNGKFDEGSDFQARMEEAFRIDPATFTAFQGVGGALGEIFAEDFAAGAQIGRVLFDEFGGNIDNLKLLFQELGVTAEEFQEALVDAFYKGEISALEFNSIIRDSSELFEEGISGIGQYQKAFEQFVASQGQGRLATQRLVDIFTEAEEAGVNGFDAIRQSLVDSGASTESVAQLFDTLAARGIGSVDQLRQASEQMRIAIVGDLQALNFEGFNDFSEGVKQSADEVGVLEERLKSLPDKVETQVTVKVNAEYENNEAREAFKLLGADAPGISR